MTVSDGSAFCAVLFVDMESCNAVCDSIHAEGLLTFHCTARAQTRKLRPEEIGRKFVGPNRYAEKVRLEGEAFAQGLWMVKMSRGITSNQISFASGEYNGALALLIWHSTFELPISI